MDGYENRVDRSLLDIEFANGGRHQTWPVCYARCPGIVRTAVSKVCNIEIARTGLRKIDARRAGLSCEVATIESTTRAGYFLGATPMTVNMLAETGSGRLLGAQIIGREGAAWRVDVCAMRCGPR